MSLTMHLERMGEARQSAHLRVYSYWAPCVVEAEISSEELNEVDR